LAKVTCPVSHRYIFLFSLATAANLNPECVGITPEEDAPRDITAHLLIQRRS